MAIETVPQSRASASPELTTTGTGAALALDMLDYIHLFTLVDLALESLPGSTDADNSRACLRAVKEFLLTKEAPLSECV